MTWAKLDDRTSSSPEWVGLTDAALLAIAERNPGAAPTGKLEDARRLAQLAKAVHLISLMWSVPALTDGRITPGGIDHICTIGSFTVQEFEAGADLLVRVGAWKLERPTKRDPVGAYRMLLGWSPGEQPTREEEVERKARARLRDALRPGAKDFPMRLAAVERAGGFCEYCDAVLGPDGGQIDHVDPELFSNDVDNLAHVCAGCNKRKGTHKLSAVGMSFTARALVARGISTRGTTRGTTRGNTRGHSVGPGRVGSGRVGTGREGSGRDGSGAVGSGSDSTASAKRSSKSSDARGSR